MTKILLYICNLLTTVTGTKKKTRKRLHFNSHFPVYLVIRYTSSMFHKKRSADEWYRLLWDGCPSCHPTNSVQSHNEGK